MKEEKQKLAEDVFEYFSARCQQPQWSIPANVGIVFARADITIAESVAEVYRRGLVKRFVVSGGVGKDSGALPELGLTEAKFLTAVMTSLGVPRSAIIMEETATNGAQNSRHSMHIIQEKNIPANEVMLIGHRTNLWRVYLTHEKEAENLGFRAHYHLVAPEYTLKPEDADMMLGELDRILKWPDKGWSVRDRGLPVKMIDRYRKLTQATG